MSVNIDELLVEVQKAQAARASLLELRDAGIPFFVAVAQVARMKGISIAEATTRVEGWEELTGIKLERW